MTTLPLYAAEAIRDLEAQIAHPGMERLPVYFKAMRGAIGMLRQGVHVALPDNAEVYRSNEGGGGPPSQDECESFSGLPAPVTCFHYAWKYHDPLTGGSSGVNVDAPKRITLVADGKQLRAERTLPEGCVFCATFISVAFNEYQKQWMLVPIGLSVKQPLTVHPIVAGCGWGVETPGTMDLTTGKITRDPTQLGSFFPDINAAVQCCHALRAGATLTEQPQQKVSDLQRRLERKFGIAPLPDFTYHVLKLPDHVSHRSGVPPGGSHDSPRFHVRRAHIRKLPTGVLTFVRQCFVGDSSRGIVDKHYQVAPPTASAVASLGV